MRAFFNRFARTRLGMFGRKQLIAAPVEQQAHHTPGELSGVRAFRFVRACEQHTAGWFWECDSEGCLVYVSGRIQDALSDVFASVLGRPLTTVFKVDPEAHDVARTLSFYLSARLEIRDYPVVGFNAPKAGAWCISGQPQFDADGTFTGYVGSGHDVSERRRSQAAITKLAFSDPLTGLANRQRMTNVVEQTLALRTSGFHPTALLMLDLDRFKMVNDTLGHQTGDRLLMEVAARLTSVIGANGLVGRLGGDEFQIVIADDAARNKVGAVADAVIKALSQPYTLNNAPISIGCSIGIAISPEHGPSAEALVRSADLALYAAKDSGRGTYRLYSDALLAHARARKELEDDLRQALSRGELHLAYQPVVSTVSKAICGFEALIRWNHPHRGPISPAEFIPLAEDCNMIEPLGEWVLRTAVEQAAQWPEHVRIAVNVSPVQFANANLAIAVTNALAASELKPERLELELTESIFLNEDADTSERFQTLKKIGVRLALDDFGTGYSSLGYLRTAPFDKIKIDQSFVRGAIRCGNRNAPIIRAIVSLADALGMETTAEGVEHQDEIDFIHSLGCTHIQGFVYGKPMLAQAASEALGLAGAAFKPLGHKVSRAPRRKILRGARLQIGRQTATVQVRNISDHGALLDGVDLSRFEPGTKVLLELSDRQVFAGRLRWARESRAGLHFSGGLVE